MRDSEEAASLEVGGDTGTPVESQEPPEAKAADSAEAAPQSTLELEEAASGEAPADETDDDTPRADVLPPEEACEGPIEDEQGLGESESEDSLPQEAESASLLEEMGRGFQRVLKAFEHKLAYDQTKDRMVDRLHGELQGYKSDLLAGATLPLTNGFIRLHDELGRVAEALLGEGAGSLDTERVVKLFEDFQGDIEIILEDNGVSRYEEPDEKFEPRRQQVLKTVPTPVADEVGRVVERVRPGFERGDRIIRKEKVTVTKLSVPQEETPTDATGDGIGETES